MSLPTAPSRLYIVLIVLVGLIGGYVIYSQWIKPSEEQIPAPVISSQDSLNVLRNVKIDFASLGTITKNLLVSGESPVNPGTTGKKDLFAPYK